MKFELINDQLCRMVEPEPLTPESKFPCVVRLIQDDSPMGRYNQSYSEYRYGVKLGCCMHPIVATHIAKNGVINDVEWDVNRYEIIGYPVVEGSAEWALYQAENGKSFEHKTAHHCRIFTMFSETELKVTNEEGEVVEFVDIDRFLSEGAKGGWQLYEPEPQLSKPKQEQPEYLPCSKCGTPYMEKNPLFEEPVPVPQPSYAVGDWVEIEQEHAGNIKRYHRKVELYSETSDAYSMKTIVCGEFEFTVDGEPYDCPYHDNWHPDHRIVRKLKPSEVVIHIGCLSGTVRQCGDKEEEVFALRTNHNAAVISFAMLNEPTLNIVKELLGKQEDEKC